MVFIVFEGGEGVGKSTQIKRIANDLDKLNRAYLCTREPGGTPFAEEIRALFKKMDSSIEAPLPLTELFLLTAARNQHLETIIIPELKKETLILCDRFLDSTYVYQSILGKIDKKIIDTVNLPVIKNLVPHITLVFLADTNTALKRIHEQSSRNPDRLDSFNISIHEKIMNGYKEVLQNNYTYPNGVLPKRVFINANESVDATYEQVKKALKSTIGLAL